MIANVSTLEMFLLTQPQAKVLAASLLAFGEVLVERTGRSLKRSSRRRREMEKEMEKEITLDSKRRRAGLGSGQSEYLLEAQSGN